MMNPAKRDDNTKERGFALLVVLWIVAAAALLVSTYNATVRSGAAFMESEVVLTQSLALFDAGVELAAAHLIDEDLSRRWKPDGTAHKISLAGYDLTVTISDPNGLVDLNKANVKVLFELIAQFSRSESDAKRLSKQIIMARRSRAATKSDKARDGNLLDAPDNRRTSRPKSRRGSERRQRQTGTEPALLDVTQIRDFEGMTKELYEKIAPFLTVYSRDGRINAYTAPVEVLSAIPNLSKADIKLFRSQSENNITGETASREILKNARAYLTNKPGPAYVVLVKVNKIGAKHAFSKVFVIVTGLDKRAPYRIITARS